MRISVIIPTLNAEGQIQSLINALKKQSIVPDEILVIDSQSDDNTRGVAEAESVHLMTVSRKSFDHGGTRDLALKNVSGDVVIFMTQDAFPVNENLIAHLIEPFKDPQVAAVGGRQIAYPQARPFEKAVRAQNYPAQSRVWDKRKIGELGVRAYMISDVCAAYRREAYLAVGGFDHPILTNEDMLIAQKFLHAGYKLAYCAEAAVYHSHNFTLYQEFCRNYLIGKTLQRYQARFSCKSEMGLGLKLAKGVLWRLFCDGHWIECFCFAANCAARLAGNRVGRIDEKRNGAVHEQKKTDG